MARRPRQEIRPTRDSYRPVGPRVTRADLDRATQPVTPLQVWRRELGELRESPKRSGRGSGRQEYPLAAYERRLSASIIGGDYIIDSQEDPL